MHNRNQKVVVISGASSGIGAAAARALRREGHTVVITGRSAATATLAQSIGAEAHIVDFARLADVRRFAADVLAMHPQVDVLANNAGAIFGERQVTEDGHEMTFQVNHLAAFLLTQLLRPALEAARGVVINTSSRAHGMGKLDFDDLESARRYSSWTAYGTTKLMNILHADELNRRFRDVSGASFHPGVVATGFAREAGMLSRLWYSSWIGKRTMLSSEEGADTLIWLATTPAGAGWTPGEFYVQRKRARKSAQAADPDLARRLWEASAALVAG